MKTNLAWTQTSENVLTERVWMIVQKEEIEYQTQRHNINST